MSGFQTKVFNSEDKNIFKFDDSKEAEMIEIKTAQNFETHVLNNADIHIQKDQAIEVKGDAVYQIENGSLTETARKIVYKVGSSTLTLKGSGAFLNAAKINLNCGGGAAEAKTEGLGAVGSGAAGNAGNNNLSGANMGNMDTSTQSDEARTNDTHDTEKTVEKLFPTLSLDLTKNTPPKNFSFVTPYGILSLTLTLNGTIDFKKLGNTSNLVIDGKSYRIEGKNILGNFFNSSEKELHPDLIIRNDIYYPERRQKKLNENIYNNINLGNYFIPTFIFTK